jgi:threonine dehydratase
MAHIGETPHLEARFHPSTEAAASREHASRLVARSDIEEAAHRIEPMVHRTPLVPMASSDSLYLKPECDQPTRSFKIRGAGNALAIFAAQGTTRHIVVHSSGNHAQSIAYVARQNGFDVTAVLPHTAPVIKVEAIRRLGATVVMVSPADREREALRICADTGGTLIPSDAFEVIAGAGTTGLEIIDDLPDVAAILVPVCTGSQLAGVAIAAKSIRPSIQVIGVEPEFAADGADSFRKGKLIAWPTERTYRTIADGLRAPSMGRFSWEHIRRYADDIVTVSEEAIVAASETLRTEAGLIAEPSGAVTTAACLANRHTLPTGPVVAIVTGGNIDSPASIGEGA